MDVAEAIIEDVFIDDILLPANDGYMLGATLFLPRNGTKQTAVLINSATAVPRKIYRPFATYLSGLGSVVLTFDYRGIGGSRPASLSGFKASMSDWAALDSAAAVSWLRGRYKGLPLGVVGHSFGGQAIGLLPNNDMISRSLLVAAQAGHWGLMPSPEKYRVYAMLNLLGKPITHLLGYTPGRLGIGEDLPKGVFLQWADWVMKERYYYDDPSLTALANYGQYKAPVRALSFTDDPWATEPMVELLCSGFTATKPQIVSIAPQAVGAKTIGHFGFFRPEHRETLWKDAAGWLLAKPA
ncbi:alpha/beta hydrolase [Afipia sp. P52-10]|nr:alpha/beta hydrolase [Afipia sp. P52-10]